MNHRFFDRASGVLIVILFLLCLWWWLAGGYISVLRTMDVSYHLAVMKGFERAGGLVGYNFWEHAPFGQPHLYPPLFHILGLILLKIGTDITTVGWILVYCLYPLSLVTTWYLTKRIGGSAAAWYSLLILSLPSLWVWKQWGHPANALVLVLTPLVFAAVLGSRYVLATVLLVLAGYCHLTALVLPVALLIYGLHLRDHVKPMMWITGLALLFCLPWIFHSVAAASGTMSGIEGPLRAIGRNMAVLLNPLDKRFGFLGLLAAGGILVAYYKGEREYLLIPSYALSHVGMFLVAPGFYEHRFLSANVLLLLAVAGGLLLSEVQAVTGERMKRTWVSVVCAVVLSVCLVAGFCAVSREQSLPSRLWQALRADTAERQAWLEEHVKLARMLRKYCRIDEYFYIQASGNESRFLSALTGRSATRQIGNRPRVLVVSRERQFSADVSGGGRFVSSRVVLTAEDLARYPRSAHAPLIPLGGTRHFQVYRQDDPSKVSRVTVPYPFISYPMLVLICGIVAVLWIAAVFMKLR